MSRELRFVLEWGAENVAHSCPLWTGIPTPLALGVGGEFVSRHDHRYQGRQGFSVSGASREIPYGSGELLYHGRSPGSALAGDPRSPGFARVAGSSRSPSDALLAVASEGTLVPRVRPSLSSGAFATGSETGPVLVDDEGSSVDGGSIRDTCSGSSSVFGCVLFGVGRSPPRSTRVRGVVGPGKVAAHQSSRDEGCSWAFRHFEKMSSVIM